jgi:translation initiation factor IF-3
MTANRKKRSVELPSGCKDLIDALKPRKKGKGPHLPAIRVNHRILAKKVEVRDVDGKSLGVFLLPAALELALSQGLDLVEADATKNPPVCLMVDYGKYRYEQSKKK